MFTRSEAQMRLEQGLGKPDDMSERRWKTVLMQMRTNGLALSDKGWRVFRNGLYEMIVDAVDEDEARLIASTLLSARSTNEIHVELIH